MKYGEGFFCVRKGERLPRKIYPATEGMDYNDGTGECCDMLMKDWCVDIRLPEWDCWIRFTIKGNAAPVLHENSFDFDFASIPTRLGRLLSCDKADYRIRAASLLHDILFCVLLEEFGLDVTNRLLREIMEAYCRPREEYDVSGNAIVRAAKIAKREACIATDAALRQKVYLAVCVGGPSRWGKKTPEEVAMYRKMLTVERLSL